jgi:hypothetical protein
MLMGWLSLSTEPFKRGVLNCPFSERVGNDDLRRHVSTNPVLAPLASESRCPCGSAR